MTMRRRPPIVSAEGGSKLRVFVRHPGFRAAWGALVLAAFTAALGCGDSGPPTAPMHPDTGVGAGDTPPATVNCVDLCLRTVYCGGQLCDEDKMTTAYSTLANQLALQCNTTCSTAPPYLGAITPAHWQCVFQSSCRQVFEQQVCGAMSHYSCS